MGGRGVWRAWEADAHIALFETFESLYLPHLIVAVAGQVRARGNVVILGLSPHGLLAITRYTGDL